MVLRPRCPSRFIPCNERDAILPRTGIDVGRIDFGYGGSVVEIPEHGGDAPRGGTAAAHKMDGLARTHRRRVDEGTAVASPADDSWKRLTTAASAGAVANEDAGGAAHPCVPGQHENAGHEDPREQAFHGAYIPGRRLTELSRVRCTKASAMYTPASRPRQMPMGS